MIGPAIPEGLLKEKASNKESEIVISFSDDEEEEQEAVVGPQIPTHVLEKKKEQQQVETGPQIPQHILDQKRSVAAGPQIPSHLLEQKRKNADEIVMSDEEEEEQEEDNIGPQIPQHILQQKRKNTDEIVMSDEEEEEVDNIGPQIPKHILEKKAASAAAAAPEEEDTADPDDFAPALPPDLLEQRQKTQPPTAPAAAASGRRRRPVGPSFPPTMPQQQQQDEDEDIVGPALPKDYNPEEEAKYSAIHAIEERARQAKEAMEKKEEDKASGKVERPEWMLVPPEVDYLKKANSSKSRQFSNNTMTEAERDNTEWTLTPAQKQQRLEDQRLGKRKAAAATEEPAYSQLDMERRRNVYEYNNQTRPLTLMEIHQQNRKKNKKEPIEDVSKRPFDREKDLLGGKKIDRKAKKELLRQSAELGSKFGYGSSSFL